MIGLSTRSLPQLSLPPQLILCQRADLAPGCLASPRPSAAAVSARWGRWSRSTVGPMTLRSPLSGVPEADTAASDQALAALDALPPLNRRKIIATYATVMSTSRQRGGA